MTVLKFPDDVTKAREEREKLVDAYFAKLTRPHIRTPLWTAIGLGIAVGVGLLLPLIMAELHRGIYHG